MNRNRGAAMPPTNCERMYGPPFQRSVRVQELKVWHWIMMSTASPRIQSKNGNRFTDRLLCHSAPGRKVAVTGSKGLVESAPPTSFALLRNGISLEKSFPFG